VPNVTIRCFAALRERAGRSTWDEVAAEGESVGALYRRLFPPGDLPVAYLVNRVTVPAATLPSAGDEVAFLPPVGGG
jgi:molybdopterin converting factor small subunit